MIRRIIFARHSVAAIVTGLTLALAAPVPAEDAMMLTLIQATGA